MSEDDKKHEKQARSDAWFITTIIVIIFEK